MRGVLLTSYAIPTHSDISMVIISIKSIMSTIVFLENPIAS